MSLILALFPGSTESRNLQVIALLALSPTGKGRGGRETQVSQRWSRRLRVAVPARSTVREKRTAQETRRLAHSASSGTSGGGEGAVRQPHDRRSVRQAQGRRAWNYSTKQCRPAGTPEKRIFALEVQALACLATRCHRDATGEVRPCQGRWAGAAILIRGSATAFWNAVGVGRSECFMSRSDMATKGSVLEGRVSKVVSAFGMGGKGVGRSFSLRGR
jgi:hypothetical protein